MKSITLKSGKVWPLNSAYQGDNIDFMNSLPDNIIDLTVTSPPYDNLRTYNDSLEWGEHIWKPILKELFRITKDGGVVVWVVADATIKGSETGTSFKQALYAMECGFNLHDTMIYEKNGTGACGSNLAYWQSFEYMFVFSKGKPKTVNKISDHINRNPGSKRSSVENSERGERVGVEQKPTGVRGNIWKYNVGFSNKDGNNFHPAVFPQKLVQEHILSWSNKNDSIFDPFMGSFTTAIASYNLQRNWIGCEKDPDYFKAGQERYGTECLQNLMDFT